MADFDPPFASVGGVNRSPTTDEQSDGFSCGPADLTLFNRLLGRIEAELKAVQDEGGIAGSESDDTTVLQAIQAMISAATGGGDTSQFVLFSQAQSRLPIFPEVTTNGGVIAVSAPATGTVRVPASATIRHRGIRDFVSVQTDFATTASKTYHIRWSPSGGFVLKDLADSGYNPSTVPEDSLIFDTTYDDILVARVITNSSNVASITNFTNKADLTASVLQTCTPVSNLNANGANFDFSVFLNWGRAPTTFTLVPARIETGNTAVVPPETDFNIRPPGASLTDLATQSAAFNVNRYGASQRIGWDFTSILDMHFSARA